MSPVEVFPFRQCADIHRTDRFISIRPMSGYRMIRPEDESNMVYATPEASDEALGQALLESLNRSRFIHPDDDPHFCEAERYMQAYRNSEKDYLRRYGYKTKREAHKNMDWCRVKRSEGKITFDLHKRDKPGYWKDLPPEEDVVISATTDAVVAGAALRRALDLCKAASEAEGR
jgi:hypothetical protein